ncbi:MAG: C39 family peptidase [Chloroflexia bacterium]
MRSSSRAAFSRTRDRHPVRPPRSLAKYLALSALSLLFVAGLYALALGRTASAAGPSTMRPYAYSIISSASSYDVMVADGINKDRRVARIKVDGIAFGTLSARLSASATNTAFRVSGDRQGGSSIYSVDVATGKYVKIAAYKGSAQGVSEYAWSPAGNTLAYVVSAPAPDPVTPDDSYGTIYIYSVGFQARRLAGSNGNDRLIRFSRDGKGVYAERQEEANGVTLDHLVFISLSGGSAQVLIRSKPTLRYSHFTVWAPPDAPTKVAALAEGTFASSGVRAPEGVPTSGKMSGPNGLGLVVADVLGTIPALLRRDLEAFPYTEWSADGTGVLVGGTRSGNAWAIDMVGTRRAAGTALLDLRVAAWSYDGSRAVLSDTPTTRLVTLNYRSGSVASTRYVGGSAKAGPAVVKLTVPYIHQVKDTAENGDGNWACGPTSVVMSLAYFGKLEPWRDVVAGERLEASAAHTTTLLTPLPPLTPSPTMTRTPTPTPTKPVTGADFAPYITNAYTAYGHSYSSVSRDPRGNLLAGLYGTICPTGSASWQEMTDVLSWHGLNSQYVPVTWDGIVGALKRGHPVLLGNKLTSEGHILVIIGYTADGNLIVNDPYGNRFLPGYGANDGNGITYQWKKVTPRRALEVIGTRPPSK